jgi:hypothetical protein
MAALLSLERHGRCVLSALSASVGILPAREIGKSAARSLDVMLREKEVHIFSNRIADLMANLPHTV